MPRFCSTCLNQDRKLRPLDDFQVKSTLLEWFEHSTFKVNVTEFLICWECLANILKISKFKRQVFKAQEIRLKVEKKKSARLVNLSKLSVYTKETVDIEYVYEEGDDEYTEDPSISAHKRKKEKSRSKSTKRKHKKKENEPEETNVERKIINIYNYYTDKNKFTRREILHDRRAIGMTPATSSFVDLTNDPKLSSLPVVLIDREIKQEIIDAEAENIISVPADEGTIINETTVITEDNKTVQITEIHEDTEMNEASKNNETVESNEATVINIATTINKSTVITEATKINGATVIKDTTKSNETTELNKTAHNINVEKTTGSINSEPENNNTISELFLDRVIKQELIDDYNSEVERTTEPEITIDNRVIDISDDIKQECLSDNETEITDVTPPVIYHRPSVIVKTEPGGDNEPPKPDSSLKFTIQTLTEDEMLDSRESDRNERMYLQHFFRCESCVVSFAEEGELERHNEDKHSELLGEFECPVCATRFPTETQLTGHEQTHYFSYKCVHCDFAHHRRYMIEMHVVNEHNLTPSPVCVICDTEFATPRRLRLHFEKVHQEKLKCNQCGEGFTNVEKLNDHAQSHTEKDDLIVMYACDICQGNFEGKAAFRAHMQCAHKGLAQRAYCEECDVQFSSFEEYRQHLKKSRVHSLFEPVIYHHPNYNSPEPKHAHRMLSHACGLCKKGFSDAMRLKDHIQQKHPEVAAKEEKDKICPICSEGFAVRNELLDHIRTHKAKKPFICKKCDKSFTSKALLNKHTRIHKA